MQDVTTGKRREELGRQVDADPLLSALLAGLGPPVLVLAHDGAVVRVGARWPEPVSAGEVWLPDPARELGRVEHVVDGARLTVVLGATRPSEVDRALLSALVDASPDWIFAKDLEHRFLMANRAFAAAIGLAPDDLIGRPDTDFWPIEQCEGDPATGRRGFHDDDRLAFSGQVVHNPHDPARVSGGEIRVFDTVKAPLRDATGAVMGVFSTSRDVTAERRAAEALGASDARLRALFEQIVVGVGEVDHQTGQLLAVNARLCQLTGYTRDELLAMSGFALTHPEDLVRDRAALEEFRLGVRGELVAEVRIVRADGALRWVQLTLSELPVGPGRRALLVVQDLEERKLAELALAEREAELRRAQKLEAVGRLAGGVAHDFNNLLTVVLSLLPELLERVRGDSVARDLVQDIHAAGMRAAGLTSQLLAFARQQPNLPRLVDVGALLTDVQPLLQRMLGPAVLRVELETPALVQLDPTHLEQVLINLVVNARDASAELVTLRVSSDGHQVVLVVEDDGSGMTEEVRAHLFEPFFTTKPPGRGTGLGLATTYGIVHQAGGAIDVDSAPGRGARFRLTFTAAAGPVKPTPPTAPARGRTVLVVEDEPAVRQVTVTVLRRAGYQVLEAADGREALDVAEPYDLLLTDVSMPGLSGPALVAELGRRGRLRHLYMSGWAGDEQGPELVPLLSKPFQPRELLRAVSAALGPED